MLNYETSFIETQFPVSKISKESYKERKAGSNQTLTILGKWWGRKPLILVRSVILGLLLPVSNDPIKDREMFLKLLTLDEEGIKLRKRDSLDIQTILQNLTEGEVGKYFNNQKPMNQESRKKAEDIAFNRLTYDEKLKYCKRPEEVRIEDKNFWEEINNYYSTNAFSFEEFIRDLSIKKYGKIITVGDSFCGGGSIPFEAYRMGLFSHGSDLNPIAGLITDSALSILSLEESKIEKINQFQESIFDSVIQIINDMGIEEDEDGWRGKAYLYCHETVCPSCDWTIPLSPSWRISQRDKTIAELIKDVNNKKFIIDIKSKVDIETYKKAGEGTIRKSRIVCPNCEEVHSMLSIRKDREVNSKTVYGLQEWDKSDFVPRESDVFTERLYAIKKVKLKQNKSWPQFVKKHPAAIDNVFVHTKFEAPTSKDLENEKVITKFILDNFTDWQSKGIIPSKIIEKGDKTEELFRTRGWTYWHQLFNPRQLLLLGLLMKELHLNAREKEEWLIGLLNIQKCADFNSKLTPWQESAGKANNAFYNQALNPLFNYACRGVSYMYSKYLTEVNRKVFSSLDHEIKLSDARTVEKQCEVWITDPPYADAVNYHELSEFFLAWNEKIITKVYNNWYNDSKRILAVRGTGESFNESMVEVYKNLSMNMPDNGFQVVMFTHQDVSVWAELTSILWSAGLRVTAAWNIATETESGGLKNGNYVKGTVILVLRKQFSNETAYLDELYPEVEEEVKSQIDSMRELDDKEDPNFTDADYLLAAYAASLKILTSYKNIEDIDVNYEISKKRNKGELSPIEQILKEAIKIAYDYLTPTGFDSFTWKTLIPEERFYIKGLEFEKESIYQLGAYQEIARGFGIREYQPLLASTKANNTRLKTAKEFAMRGISESDKFGSSLLRNVLAALYQSIKAEDTIKGRNWLKNEVPDYWNQRTTIIELLNFIISLGHHEHMKHWEDEAKYARILSELVNIDGV
ncbi:DUF1156 domain-containing protein [Peribacillus frigoritolerans]|uniref:anti-phage-associated DUF1156 domain-containing protein n=1 Tax=Peribacillus frigoritolerans TaxID=450367 RepID=UPI002E1F425A|nr:anti-phage-associated DUF1156 domain-containing protein [Peribacillus frigoritolerans]MED3892784.1 DUF1156 domain-containing protein [Peribacillus frigoritolerans]